MPPAPVRAGRGNCLSFPRMRIMHLKVWEDQRRSRARQCHRALNPPGSPTMKKSPTPSPRQHLFVFPTRNPSSKAPPNLLLPVAGNRPPPRGFGGPPPRVHSKAPRRSCIKLACTARFSEKIDGGPGSPGGLGPEPARQWAARRGPPNERARRVSTSGSRRSERRRTKKKKPRRTHHGAVRRPDPQQ